VLELTDLLPLKVLFQHFSLPSHVCAYIFVSYNKQVMSLVGLCLSDDDIVAADILSQQKAIVTLHPTS
jgi:hypothetical protein